MKESELEMQIGHYLSAKNFCFWKQPTTGYFDPKLKRFRRQASPFARNGVPDFAVIYKGYFLGLELKSEKGRQSDEQKDFERYLREVGKAPYRLVRSLDEAIEVLTQFRNWVEKLYEDLFINKGC